jgi:hypothetical protein
VAGRVHGAPVQLTQGRELGVPHGAPAFERAFQAVLNDENRGRHVGHTQVVDYLDDTWRLALLGAVQGAEPGMHWRQPRSIAVDYEGEAHAGDQLVARAWTTSEWASDAALDLVRPGDQRCIARARFLFYAINPKGNVPAIVFADGSMLNENVATLTFLADQGNAGLAPQEGTTERYAYLNDLGFVTSELHPAYGALFNPKLSTEAREAAMANVHGVWTSSWA